MVLIESFSLTVVDNWSNWRKNTLLVIVSFHGFMSTFLAAATIPAFESLSQEFGVSLTRISYTVSIQIAVIGFLPLFWTPLSNRFGRRPIYLISSLASAALTLANAYTRSYITFMLVRAIQAAFISTAVGIGGATVAEMFFRHERGVKMGVWTLLVTLGPPSAPFIFGFVVEHKNWHWIFYILAIVQLAMFFAYLFFGPETLYMRNEHATAHRGTISKSELYFKFRRINPAPLRISDFFRPYLMLLKPEVFFAALSYAIVFVYTSVLLSVETPQLFGMKFHFNPQQIGYQFVALIIGSVLGEQFGGRLSDAVINRRARSAGFRIPEMRLVAAWPAYILVCIGLIIYGVLLQQTPALHWNVKPLIGSAIAAFAAQIITTVMITYAIESHLDRAPDVSIIITAFRQTLAFIGPFYFTAAFENLEVGGACSLFGALCAAALLPVLWLEFRPAARRRAREARSRANAGHEVGSYDKA